MNEIKWLGDKDSNLDWRSQKSAVLPLDDPPPGRNVERKSRPCKAEWDSSPF